MGLFNLILSLLPGRLMTLVELFGYHGDRQEGLNRLYKTGGWEKNSSVPSIAASAYSRLGLYPLAHVMAVEDEGLRRSPCDLVLLLFHLVLSSITFDGVDTAMAQTIVDWNLKRFPNGKLWLFFFGLDA